MSIGASGIGDQASDIKAVTALVEWLPHGGFHLWQLTLRDAVSEVASLGLPYGVDPPALLSKYEIPVNNFDGFLLRTLEEN